jgi:Xaa-Pro aminopeptidase
MTRNDDRVCTPISLPELQRRWTAVQAQMAEAKVDAVVVQGQNNLSGGGGYYRWLTGLSVPSSYPQTVILPRDGLMTLVGHGPLGSDTKLDGKDPSLPGVGRRLGTSSFPAVGYTGAYDAELVAKAIQEAGYRRLGVISPNTMYYGFGSRLRELLAGVTLVDITAQIDPIKAIKSAEEITLIRQAAAMQDEILTKVRTHIQPGMTDYQALAYGHYLGQTMGSETGYFLGSSAAPGQPAMIRLRHQQGRTLREGDVLMWQAENTGPGGYFVHLARYIVLGKAPQELVDGFGQMVEAQAHTARMLKPGADCARIFAEYNDYMRGCGLPPETRLHCHGQGTDVVERPLVRHDETMKLAPDMNIGIHPSFGNARLFVTVCDNFLTRPDGSLERLHRTPQEIIEP